MNARTVQRQTDSTVRDLLADGDLLHSMFAPPQANGLEFLLRTHRYRAFSDDEYRGVLQRSTTSSSPTLRRLSHSVSSGNR